MTDAPDVERAERLARLNRRRQATDGPTADVGSSTSSVPAPVFVPPTSSAHVAPTSTGKRRSPATTAKIVTVGASTTAVLGIMAGYGIAEQAAASQPVLLPADEAAAPALAPLATVPPAAAVPTAPPQVIVVVIDGATGQPVTGDFDLSAIAAGATSTAIASSSSDDVAAPAATPAAAPTAALAPAPTAAPAPAPVAATAVDLAVPAPPPPPAPAPAAAAPAAAPAPPPQASSGGS